MAKNIKVIKCPQCGSTKKTEIKPDFFVCDNCKTEYYLDNDDVHIYNYNQPATPANGRIVNPLVLGGIALMVVLGMFLPLIFRKSTPPPKPGQEMKAPFRFHDYKVMTYKNNSNELEYAMLGSHEKNGQNSQQGYVLVSKVYDNKGRILKENTYDKPYTITHFMFDQSLIENDDKYFVMKYTDVYKYDKAARMFSFANNEWEKNASLAQGIARVETSSVGDYFIITTLNGNQYNYYPIADTAVKKEDVYKFEQGQKLTDSLSRTIYKFQDKDRTTGVYFLYKYDQAWQKGFYRQPYLDFAEWLSDIQPKRRWARENHQSNVQLFAPDRNFFGPDILCLDDRSVIISYRVTPGDANLAIQSLDAATAAVQWSIQLQGNENSGRRFTSGAMNEKEIMLANYGEVLILDRATGKTKLSIPLNKG